MTGAQIERARAKEKGVAVVGSVLLKDDDYDEFEAMLHGLSVSRPLIKAAMGFAFDKVESAKEISDILKESLLVKETPVAVKMARLYLLSDILHNSGIITAVNMLLLL